MQYLQLIDSIVMSLLLSTSWTVCSICQSRVFFSVGRLFGYCV